MGGGLGFCGEGFGLSWLSQEKIRAFVGRDSGFRAASGFRGEDLRFRGDLFFSWGFELSWGGIRAFESMLRI